MPQAPITTIKRKPAAVAGRKTKEERRGQPPSAKTLAEQKAAKAAADAKK
jgi:hypothetical protein